MTPELCNGRARLGRRFPWLLALPVVALAGGCGFIGGNDDAAAPGAEAITAYEGWFAASPGPDAVGYGTVWNQTDADVTIVAAESAAAAAVELRDPARTAVDGLVVPANGYLSLSPGSASLGLIGLADPVVDGETVTVTLTLLSGQELELTGQAVTIPADAGIVTDPAVAPSG